MKSTIILLLVIGIAAAAGGMMIAKYSTERTLAETSRPADATRPAARAVTMPRSTATVTSSTATPRPEKIIVTAPAPSMTTVSLAAAMPTPGRPLPVASPTTKAKVYQAPQLNDGALNEEIGRAALAFVGVDRDAERIWVSTINDMSVPANARKNLIEDLNEDGLSDPRNPTLADLPMITRRMMIIERLSQNPADDVNAAALAEAYKDLTNMYNNLTGN